MAITVAEVRQWCLFPGISNPLSNQIDQSQIAQTVPTKLGVYTLTKVLCHCSHLSSAYRTEIWIDEAPVLRVIRLSSHLEEHRALRITQPAPKNACMCFFHCIFLPALMETSTATTSWWASRAQSSGNHDWSLASEKNIN